MLSANETSGTFNQTLGACSGARTGGGTANNNESITFALGGSGFAALLREQSNTIALLLQALVDAYRTQRCMRASRERASSVFIQIFFGHVILGHFMGMNFSIVAFPGFFNPRDHFGFEGVTFFHQLVNTLRIHSFESGQVLQISRLLARMRNRGLKRG